MPLIGTIICAYCKQRIQTLGRWSERGVVDQHPLTLQPAYFHHLNCHKLMKMHQWIKDGENIIPTQVDTGTFSDSELY